MVVNNDTHQSEVELSESLDFISVAVKIIKNAKHIMDKNPTYRVILRCNPTLLLGKTKLNMYRLF